MFLSNLILFAFVSAQIAEPTVLQSVDGTPVVTAPGIAIQIAFNPTFYYNKLTEIQYCPGTENFTDCRFRTPVRTAPYDTINSLWNCAAGSFCSSPGFNVTCTSGFYCPKDSIEPSICPERYYCKDSKTISRCPAGFIN